MAFNFAAEIDAWVRSGGMVLAASERAARAARGAYHDLRRKEGLTAWADPPILHWNALVRSEWERRSPHPRLVLNPLQEQALWSDILRIAEPDAALLRTPRRRLASLAMEAHGLLCSHAPTLLEVRARRTWQQDAASFSRWAAEFAFACESAEAISADRLAMELADLLEAETQPRPPLLLIGFDRLQPIQAQVLERWGAWQHMPAPGRATDTFFYAAPDPKSEFAACAIDCRTFMQQHPQARILVLSQDLRGQRGAMERAFLRYAPDVPFEFSLGIPLADVSAVRAALLLLRWLTAPLAEHEMDWLFSSGNAVESADEASALQSAMRTLRRRGLARVEWQLPAFLQQSSISSRVPAAWRDRMHTARQSLARVQSQELSPLEWAALVPQLLESVSWPGAEALSSAAYQAIDRFHQIVESCGSLAFDGRMLAWADFSAELQSACQDTLFSPQSEQAPVLIAGPAEAAGLTADAVWFLGATDDAWPSRGSVNSLLPRDVQRQYGMPHASPQMDWELAQAIANRVLTSAAEVHFSFARQVDGVDMQPSRVIAALACEPQPLPAHLVPPDPAAPLTVRFEDSAAIPFVSSDAHSVRGGANVLTSQSQCAFKAFATTRLGAAGWELAQMGLSPSVRGQLLHAVLHAIWAGPPRGIRTLEDLQQIADRASFVSGHVDRALTENLTADITQELPQRYLDLEAIRLTSLVSEWLDYELARAPFAVEGTEMKATTLVAGLSLELRFDRVDRLADGSMLVVDYKTGDVSPKAWNLPRPEDVQLPLYSLFGLPEDEMVGGLMFARVRPGDVCFAGRALDPATSLGGVKNISSLKRTALTVENLSAWREELERLAHDFLAGRADVNPRDTLVTCKRCGLHTICRIADQPRAQEEENAEVSDV